MSDTYDRVKSESVATDIESKISKLIEYGHLLFFITRKKGEDGYHHIFHYNDNLDDDEDGDQNKGPWEGRVRKITRMQNTLL